MPRKQVDIQQMQIHTTLAATHHRATTNQQQQMGATRCSKIFVSRLNSLLIMH